MAFLRVTSALTLQVAIRLLEKSKISVRKNVNANANASNATESRRLTGRTDDANEHFKYVTELASCFHLHVNANSELLERVTDRGEMGIVFQAFLSDMSLADRTRQECRALEGKVMASLRRQRLLRSKRIRDRVIMTMARMGGPGDFPSQEAVVTERERVLSRLANAESNKEGVKVSAASFGDEVVGIRDSRSLPFSTTSEDPSITLLRVSVEGGVRANNVFSVVQTKKMPFLMGRAEHTVTVAFQSRYTGVYHCQIHFCFQTKDMQVFEIVRCIKMRCGDAKLEEILKPVAPFVQRRMKYFDKAMPRVGDVFNPPEQPRKGVNAESNPFLILPQYKIPQDVRDLIVNNEIAAILDKPETSLDSYGTFWSSILHVSEFQAYLDIKLFDMEEARLTKEGNYFVLVVPGLAEGRPSVLRGDIVNITWKNMLYRARVHKTRLLDVILEMHSAFHDSFHGALDHVDVRFTLSRTTFRTSHDGVLKAPETMGYAMLLPDSTHIEESLKANRSRMIPSSLNFANRDLNYEQQSAVVSIIRGACRPTPNIVWGPPGTGKSTTIVEAVYQLARHRSKPNILLVAPSNDAADLLVEKLAQFFPPTEMRRLLAYSRSSDQLGPAVAPYARESLSSEELAREACSAPIIVCTVNLAARLAIYGVPRGHFDVLCVDEAGHATEPEVVAVASTLMDFQRHDNRVGQLILAGDPKQLGPIVTSNVCRKFGLEVSYMERIACREVYAKDSSNRYPTPLITKLVRNYRSHPSILKLPNNMFYDGELVAEGNPLKTFDMIRWEYLPNAKFPLFFHAVFGENLREGNSPSWFNPEEAQEVVKYVDTLVYNSRPPVDQKDIGVITPYARQAQKIRLALASRNLKNVKVGSVETFQGQERRCIILSTVRSDVGLIPSDLKYNLGFVANSKRFNVAMTRAASLLVVIGDPNVLAADKLHWLPFLRYCKENNGWMGEAWDDTGDVLFDAEEFDEAEYVTVEHLSPSERVAQESIGFINREE